MYNGLSRKELHVQKLTFRAYDEKSKRYPINSDKGNGFRCDDIDECTTFNDLCTTHRNQHCINTPGSYECICREGYEKQHGDAVVDRQNDCINIDECSLSTHNCHTFATCTDKEPLWSCKCNDGYHGDGHYCTKINYCQPNPCPLNSQCVRQWDQRAISSRDSLVLYSNNRLTIPH